MRVPSREVSSSLRGWTVAASVALLVILVALFFRTMDRDLNHDEHQFLAPGALLSREGLLPYRDYPLFHLPNLVFLYAAGNLLVDSPILAAKLICFLSSAGMLCLLAIQGFRIPGRYGALTGVFVSLLLFFDPVFYYTAGKTWNHEVPSFLMLLAVVLQASAVTKGSFVLAIASGVAAALAAGTRLTFAPVLIPICGAAFIGTGTWRHRWLIVLTTVAGVLIGLLPSFWLLAQAPANFIFGNFEFPRLRLLDPNDLRIQKTVLLSSKLRYFFKDILLPSLPLYVAFAAFAVRPVWFYFRTDRSRNILLVLILTSLPFALAGCFLPARYQYQHFFSVQCLLVLGVATGSHFVFSSPHSRARGVLAAVLVALVTLSATLAFRATDKKQTFSISFRTPDRWFFNKARLVGGEIKLHAPTGPILTLAPAWPLEAGLSIYPEFGTAPFGWRSAPFAEEAVRKHAHLVAPVDLAGFLAARPPAAILTGVEDEHLEEPFVSYAQQNGWRRVLLSKGRELWLPK